MKGKEKPAEIRKWSTPGRRNDRHKGLEMGADLMCSKPEKKGQCGWSIEGRRVI